MKWNIVCDSSCDLKEDFIQSEDIGFEIVPLTILIGEKEYVDDDLINTDAMLAAMEQEKSVSRTSCPSPEGFANAFMKAEQTICFTISSQLSGTYNGAKLGQQMAEEAGFQQVYVVDTKSTAGTFYQLIQKTIEFIKEGCTFEEVCEKIEQYKEKLKLTFALFNFDNLVKNGRVSALAGIIIKNIGISAVADRTAEGTIKVARKTKGEMRTYKTMIEHMKKQSRFGEVPIVINHCKNSEGAEKIKKMLHEIEEHIEVKILECKGLTSFYAMEKGIIIAY